MVTVDKWYNHVDIFIYDNDAYLGDMTAQDIELAKGDTYSLLSPVNLKDLIFKNFTAGSNTRVVLSGVPMTNEQIKQEGLH